MSRPDDDLQKWFDGLSKKVRSQLSDVVKGEAYDLSAAQLSRLRSLEKPPEETGDLEASCRVEPGASEAQFVVLAGGETTTVKGDDHALNFEFGTRKQPARSFFWSTYRERAAGIRERIEGAIEKAIK
ncbi:hypothetical protein [uncultured Bradyrhizobium sp.]|uniref:hypothetical protein n=1 Tax=uncultured Bradyrhizobium sp. TaxID=199684 RepID=UPI0035CC588C